MKLKSFIFLQANLCISILLFISVDSLSQTTTECFPTCRSGYVCYNGKCISKCNPPCPEGQTCNDSGECVYEINQQTQNSSQKKPELLPEKPRKSRRKPIVAVITGSLSGISLIAGFIYHSKKDDPYYEWLELHDDWKKATGDEKKDIEVKMDQKANETNNIKTRRNISFVFAGAFAITLTINLIIPSKEK